MKPAFFSASVGAAAISKREAVAAVGLAALLRMHVSWSVSSVGRRLQRMVSMYEHAERYKCMG